MKFFSAAGFRSDQEYTLYNKVATRLLPFLLLLYIVAFLDRVNVSFAKLSMAADAGIGDAAYGLGAGIFFIAYCLFEIPSNLILRRVGARFWIARIMFIWGLVCAAMAWVHSPLTFYVTRFILGIAEAGFYPGVVFYLTYWFPRRLRGQATAIFVIGIPLAGVIGAPMCGWVMAHMGGVAALPRAKRAMSWAGRSRPGTGAWTPRLAQAIAPISMPIACRSPGSVANTMCWRRALWP